MMRTRMWMVPVCLWASLACVSTASAGQTYLALGDSLAFGVGANQTASDVSNGDRGYVGAYADYLATQNGGVRPTLVNLAVSGESSESFFGNGIGLDGPGSSLRNTNYSSPNTPTQNELFLSTLASQQALGNTISDITVQLGANDLFLLAFNPAFQAANPADQALMLQALFGTIQTNYTNLLGEILAMAPGANLVLLGYYDPFAPFSGDPTSPFFAFSQLSGQAIPLLNNLIQGLAGSVNARYVDISTPFVGHELDYTYITSGGNVHPTDLGYEVIAQQLTAVPEPSTIAMMGLGVVAAGAFGARRLRRAA